MVMKTIKLMVVQMSMGVDDNNGDIVDFDDEAGGTRETKC